MKPHYLISLLYILMGLSLSSCAALPFLSDPNWDQPGSGTGPATLDDSISSQNSATESAEQARLAEASRLRHGLAQRDIVMGMPMNDVLTVWGEPTEIETAGDPAYGNQRWVYSTGLSSRWSLGNARIVYFEQGRVAGWDTR